MIKRKTSPVATDEKNVYFIGDEENWKILRDELVYRGGIPKCSDSLYGCADWRLYYIDFDGVIQAVNLSSPFAQRIKETFTEVDIRNTQRVPRLYVDWEKDLKPGDRVLYMNKDDGYKWTLGFFSHFRERGVFILPHGHSFRRGHVIPYNEMTEDLIGTDRTVISSDRLM